MILELTGQGIERIADGREYIFMSVIMAMGSAHRQLFIGHAQIDPHLVQTTLVVLLVRLVDGDAQRDNML